MTYTFSVILNIFRFLVQVADILDDSQLWTLLNDLRNELGSNICDVIAVKAKRQKHGVKIFTKQPYTS